MLLNLGPERSTSKRTADMREERRSKETGSSQQAGQVRGDNLTENYSQDGKTEQGSGKRNGKQATRTTVNDQHGMTE